MICPTARDWLLTADHPVRLADAPADVACHVHGCPTCQQVMARVARLDQAWRELPVPATAHAATKFLDQALNSPAQPRPSARRWALPAGVSAVIALTLVLVIGLWLAAPTPMQANSEVVLERLIDWNLRMTESKSPEERAKLFAEHADSLKTDLNKVKWNAEDRQIAQTLYDNGAWLAANDDSLEEADRFTAVADQMLARMESAAGGNDARTTQLLLVNYERISARGIDAKVAKVKNPDGDPLKKIERIHAREAKRLERLQQLHDQFPDASKKELHRIIEQSAKKQKKNHKK
jgi:hypothetical protein